MTDWYDLENWQPIVDLDDFFEATGHEFHAVMNRFRDATKDHGRDPSLILEDGWHDISPRMAEELLKRNTRNRPVDFRYVQAYGTHMANQRWKKTGEAIIVNANGDVDDAGHRLWASYLSNSTFTTYVVNVEADPDLFAFIDSGRSRNGNDTLVTAGIGPQSALIARIVKNIAMPFDESCLSYNGRLPRPPCTSVDILDYVRANPEMVETVRVVREIYPAAIKRIGDLPVAAFIGWKIQTLYGSGVLEDFFGDLARSDLPLMNPISVLQRRLDEHVAAQNASKLSPKKKMHLTPTKILALTIRSFNSWRLEQPMRRLDPRADDAFPDFDTTEIHRAAAE